MTYNFTDRASYITAIKEWAQNYRDLSNQIRKAKLALKDAFRKGSGTYAAIGNLEGLQEQAREEINWRHGSKEEANRQYLASKAV